MADTTTTELFNQALTTYRQDSLNAEKALRAGGAQTASDLKNIAADQKQTPLARFIATTIAAWIDDGGALFEAAMDALNTAAQRAAKTPVGVPEPDLAASELELFDNIYNFVALRLLKETDWPQWKMLTAIIHMGHWAMASVLPALDQFSADLKSGKHTNLGGTSDAGNAEIVKQLVEAVDLVCIVIKEEAKKADDTPPTKPSP